MKNISSSCFMFLGSSDHSLAFILNYNLWKNTITSCIIFLEPYEEYQILSSYILFLGSFHHSLALMGKYLNFMFHFLRVSNKHYIKNPAYGKQRISRPMRIESTILIKSPFCIKKKNIYIYI